MTAPATWPHYDDLPYEVVCVRIDSAGAIVSEELVSRHSLHSEAAHEFLRSSRNLVNRESVRVQLRDWRAFERGKS